MDENEVFEDNVRCWVCLDCGFAFDADHVNADGTGYSCPVCEITGMCERIAQRLFEEAEIARNAPNGQHPKISIRTHAAALRFAADLVRSEGNA